MKSSSGSPWAVALLALMKVKGVGRKAALRLVDAVAAAEAPLRLRDQLCATMDRQSPAGSLDRAWAQAEKEVAQALCSDVRPVAYYDDEFPRRLRAISDPPAVIFVKGDLSALNTTRSIAIVGTRQPTPYGVSVARKSARAAVENGFVVVSGLAHGCDTYAHSGCVEARGVGVAVLAHGLDKLYPAANKGLAAELLASSGCLVSEYALGVRPFPSFFAERDRIQSGLSDVVLVIETDVKGGTMHTVRFAMDQHREVASIAHPPEWLSEEKTKGNQQLIRTGKATPIHDSDSLVRFLKQFDSRETQLRQHPTQLKWQF